jgi:hypothetical protein
MSRQPKSIGPLTANCYRLSLYCSLWKGLAPHADIR